MMLVIYFICDCTLPCVAGIRMTFNVIYTLSSILTSLLEVFPAFLSVCVGVLKSYKNACFF